MRIGTVGTGAIVEDFLTGMEQVENVECTAVFSRSEETARALADKFNVKKFYTAYDELLCDGDVDFIYIASPNSLHFKQALQALQKGKHVICEKPFTSTVQEVKTLTDLAREKELFLFEAVTTIHFPNYKKVKEHIGAIGDLKLVQCNYSQYSSRYDKFLLGEVTNIFSPEFSGGALTDINIYNLHFAIGLFGRPKEVKYAANLAGNGIDTSGIALLEYDDFVCECTGAKDSNSPSFAIIQGTKGYIRVNGPVNSCTSFEVGMGGSVETYNYHANSDRFVYEIKEFADIYENRDYKRCYGLFDHSVAVIETAVKARKDAGVVFAADKAQT